MIVKSSVLKIVLKIKDIKKVIFNVIFMKKTKIIKKSMMQEMLKYRKKLILNFMILSKH